MKIILKLARKEIRKHRAMYLFITMQIAITLLIGITCGTIFSNQFAMYRKFHWLMEGDGKFISSMGGVRVPEADVNTGISGTKILEKYMQKTDIISCYHVLGHFMRETLSLDWNITVYDDLLAQSHVPLLQEGEWYQKGNAQRGELRAVISSNAYGIGVGDYISVVPYEEELKEVKVRVIGILDQDAQIIKFQASDNMVSYRNFLNTCDNENGMPTMLFLKSDFSELYDGNGLGENLLWPSGMMFFFYREGIADEERILNDSFIKNYFNAQIEESLSEVRQKSVQYLWEQVWEVLPILVASMLFVMISTISVGVLGTKYALENYRVYNMIGLSQKECSMIQMCINLLILERGVLFVAVTAGVFRAGLEYFGKKSMPEIGIIQFGQCLVMSLVWFLLSYLLQKSVLKDAALWRIEQND